ncbi:MAG: HAD-IA family hydrolase [Pseudoxanthomonas sp.]
MSATALVLFDLDGVLAHYEHAPRLRVLAERTGTTERAVSRALFESGLEQEADLGLHDAQGHADELARRLGSPVAPADLIAARAAAMTANAGVLALAHQVARKTRVAILTNNNLLLRDNLAAICPPLFPLFEQRVFCSAQFRLGKPDPNVFLLCLEALDTPPEACFFIDDKPENPEGARAAGLSAHHYLNNDALLRAELFQRGLLEDRSDAP